MLVAATCATAGGLKYILGDVCVFEDYLIVEDGRRAKMNVRHLRMRSILDMKRVEFNFNPRGENKNMCKEKKIVDSISRAPKPLQFCQTRRDLEDHLMLMALESGANRGLFCPGLVQTLK